MKKEAIGRLSAKKTVHCEICRRPLYRSALTIISESDLEEKKIEIAKRLCKPYICGFCRKIMREVGEKDEKR